jgi:hypothetical protein
VLIAGSQLSSIGKLDSTEARFWVALVGAVVGLGAVVGAVWIAVQLLLPVSITLDELAGDWNAAKPKATNKPAIEFFKHHPRYLQNTGGVQVLKQQRDNVVSHVNDLMEKKARGEDFDERELGELHAAMSVLDSYAMTIEGIAQHKALEGQFKTMLRKLLIVTGLAATGIVMFSWAANPPADPPKAPSADLSNARFVDADLRGVQLKNAKLNGASFVNSDLTGANLQGASVTDTKWVNSICPDGKKSDAIGKTCRGHLSP